MKRSSFKRKRSRNRSRNPFPRKKSKPMRARSPTNSYRKRERFPSYMLAVKSLLPCAALIVEGHKCDGPLESDHAGPRGVKQKAHDSTVIPLCKLAHRQRADFSGPFRSWDQTKMRAFLASRIVHTQRYMSANGYEIPPGISVADLRTIQSWLAPPQPARPIRVSDFTDELIRDVGNVDVRHPDTAPLATEGNHR